MKTNRKPFDSDNSDGEGDEVEDDGKEDSKDETEEGGTYLPGMEP